MIEIPREWMQELPDEEPNYKHIVRLGIRQLKMERAVQLYLDGVGSPGYTVNQLGIEQS